MQRTKTVLVVDDSRAVRAEVSRVFSEFRVLEATDGAEGAAAIELLEDGSLVICDINMPNVNGIEMLVRAADAIRRRNVKVVMLTTEGQPALVRRARALGAMGWLLKPFKPDQLLAGQEADA